MSEMDSRKEFEAWWKSALTKKPATFWDAWQASRAALQQELEQLRAEIVRLRKNLAEAEKRLDRVVWGE